MLFEWFILELPGLIQVGSEIVSLRGENLFPDRQACKALYGICIIKCIF